MKKKLYGQRQSPVGWPYTVIALKERFRRLLNSSKGKAPKTCDVLQHCSLSWKKMEEPIPGQVNNES